MTEQPLHFRRPVGRPKGRPTDPNALARLDALLEGLPRRADLLVECLHRIQDTDGHLSPAMLAALADALKCAQAEVFEVATFYHHFDVLRDGEPPPAPLTVRVCESISCAMQGAGALADGLAAALGDGVRVQRVPCVGRCAQAPVAVVDRHPVAPASVGTVRSAIEAGRRDCAPPQAPDLAAALEAGAYSQLRRCLAGHLDREAVFASLESAQLRGLGGAGFPTGRKWRTVAAQPAPRLMAINADEGEPGTFKDREWLEREPHRILEGMLIGAWAVGAQACYLYLRDEYAGVRTMLQGLVAQLAAWLPAVWPDGGAAPRPELHLRRGAGAYVCGEESAMIESIEGRRGMPRLRPPYVAQVGLFGRPTLVNNPETLAWVPSILDRGPGWYAGHGRRGRRGLRSFSVSGRVREPGVKIAPAGISVRELIDEHCGGMADGHRLYGFLPGGASGGILPASHSDVALDFDTLAQHGAFVGSCAIVVLSDRDRARDVAANLMHFFRHESCGQCTPCRVGTAKAETLLAAPVWDRVLLGELSQAMRDASICGLGQAAPNPVDAVLRYFPDEVTAG
jgi:NADH:ubiquinone oxidoreductase subunit F (NADH-binding)/NADH:ubiquinone oxidoreductase subunit E